MLKLIFYKKLDFSIVGIRVDGSSDNVLLTADALFLEFINDNKFSIEEYGYVETTFPEDWILYCWEPITKTCVKNPNLVASNGPRQSSSGIPSTDTSTV